MFWGCTLRKSTIYSLDTPDHGIPVLHLSNASLSLPPQNSLKKKPQEPSKVFVQAKVGAETFTLCSLEKEKRESFALTVFFHVSQTVRFFLAFENDEKPPGPLEVHLTGFWDSTMDLPNEVGPDDPLSSLMGGLEDEEEDEADLTPEEKALMERLKTAQANSQRNALIKTLEGE